MERFLEDDFNARLLLLVAYAKRPLEIKELTEAIAVGSCSNYGRMDNLSPHKSHLDEEEILERGRTLLEVTEGRYVSLIYQSVVDFLVKENPFRNLDTYHNLISMSHRFVAFTFVLRTLNLLYRASTIRRIPTVLIG